MAADSMSPFAVLVQVAVTEKVAAGIVSNLQNYCKFFFEPGSR
jgi:hypothetical protein